MEPVAPVWWGGELNLQERWKLERHPLDVYEAVLGRYCFEGPEAIAAVPGELERLKWVGIYPQRQGGDAFMLRVKIPAGRLVAAQARCVGELALEFAKGPFPHPRWGDQYCDITTRQGLQLHWLRIGDIPEIWRRLAEVGLTTVQACGDSARNVVGCPVAGIDPSEAFDASPVVAAISDFFTGNREYANLPRKFKISVTGCVEDCAQAEINDVGFWPARRGESELGFNVLAGGGLSDGPRLASDLDLFVTTAEAPECARAIAQVFAELGNRENRGFSRMRYLVEALGPERFRAEVAERAAFELQAAGEALTRRYRGDHVGVHAQRREPGEPERCYVGLSVAVGRLNGKELVEVARLAQTYGDGGVRLTNDQGLVLTGVERSRLDNLLAEPLLALHSPFPGPFSRGVVACTGSEFCRFAVVETKERALEIAAELDRRFGSRLMAGALRSRQGSGTHQASGTGQPPVDEQASGMGEARCAGSVPHASEVLRLHLSGCPASCAQPQIADIGLRGDTAHVAEEIVEAVDIGLGGRLGTGAGFGSWVAGQVPVERASDALSAVIEAYLAQRFEGEAFHDWVRRTPASELRGQLEGTTTRAPG